MATLTHRLGLRSLPPLLSHHRVTRILFTAAAAIVGIPVAVGILLTPPLAFWLRSWKRFFERHTIAQFTTSPPETPRELQSRGAGGDRGRQGEEHKLCAIDKDVLSQAHSGGKYIIARERVVSREPIGVSRLEKVFRRQAQEEEGNLYQDEPSRGEVVDFDAILNAYLRTTMSLFARYTPQGHIMRLHPAIRNEARRVGRDTFSVGFLSRCEFLPGDTICGVYVVERRECNDVGSRVLLRLRAPPEWKGPAPSGVLDLGVELVGDGDDTDENRAGAEPVGQTKEKNIRFINETILWRGKDEKPVFLETWLGRWMHSLMAAWFVVRGTEAVMVLS